MRKIAPRLHEAVSHVIAGPLRDDAERELSALLAVARAAQHLVLEDRNRAPGTIHCEWQDAVARTVRALARLARRGAR